MVNRNLIAAINYSIGLLALTGSLLAQDLTPQQTDQPHSWRRAAPSDSAAPAEQQPAPEPSALAQNTPPPPPAYAPDPFPARPAPSGPPSQNFGLPARLTIKPGTFVAVRINQWLSSDRNQPGDAFFATLAEPIVVDGVIVAQRGQTVTGRVTEAVKAGRVEGTSKLGLELTGLTVVDGTQLGLRSEMVNRNGGTSVGRDLGAMAGTTGLGAAVGAAAAGGPGAAIGAGAGAAASLIGVLLTRGRPTVVYPETPLTFRVTEPVTIATDRAPQVFRYVEPQDYARSAYSVRPQQPAVTAAPLPYYYRPYPYWGYPYYGGFSVYVGPGYYGYYGGYRGFRR